MSLKSFFVARPRRPASRLAAALLLALCVAGCSRPKLSNLFSFASSSSAPAQPLSDVLPGRWRGEYKGQKYLVTFGRHQEVSVVIDVPLEYRARLGTDQLWIGGNYHVENDHSFNCQWTDGRWAEILAQMGGIPLHRVGVKSFSADEFVDGDDTTWKCLGHAPAGRGGEAVDIADQAPVINDAPRTSGSAAPAGQPVATKTLYDQQKKLTVLYNRLEEHRKKLNPKDKNAVAAFNREAEAYSREVAAFNSGSPGGKPAAMPPGPPAAGAR